MRAAARSQPSRKGNDWCKSRSSMSWSGNIRTSDRRASAGSLRFLETSIHGIIPRTPMLWHHVKVHTSAEKFPQEEQLAWKIAEVAADPVGVERDVAEMIANRVIDNAAVAIAAINRRPVVSARSMALAHPRKIGAAIFGVESGQTFSTEWAAWANGTAVRELDMHDTFLAAEFGHPGDNIPPILAVAQTMEKSGRDLIRGIATGYEIQIDLVRAICLHEHKIDHIGHLCP